MAHTNDPTENAYSTSWPETSVKTSTIGGIITNIFGIEEVPEDCTEVTCLWLLHPRLQTQACMKAIAALSIADWYKHRAGAGSSKGLIAVSFDQRNHGSRKVDDKANQAWREGNETHAQDMFSIYRGTALDTSLLLDHVTAYAFPTRPINITQNIVLGISLGGHAAWHVLLHDDRFDSGVVVIGCPDYLRMMSDRARLSKLSSYTASNPPGTAFVGSKDFPADLVEAVRKYDPAGLLQTDGEASSTSEGVKKLRRLLGGKSILNLSGGADKLVPYHCGEPFLRWLKGVIGHDTEKSEGRITFQDKIFDGVGHQFTPSMLEEAIAFISNRVGASNASSNRQTPSKI